VIALLYCWQCRDSYCQQLQDTVLKTETVKISRLLAIQQPSLNNRICIIIKQHESLKLSRMFLWLLYVFPYWRRPTCVWNVWMFWCLLSILMTWYHPITETTYTLCSKMLLPHHFHLIFIWYSRKNKNEDTLKHLLKTIPEQGIKYELKLCIDRLVSCL
jgi:hypothetical protein